jgi:HJR/Mrr/RecB family endonuclease
MSMIKRSRPVKRSVGASKAGKGGNFSLLAGVLLVSMLIDLRVALFVAAIIVAVVLFRLFSRSSALGSGELAQLYQNIGSMSGEQFEVFLANLFKARGYQATVLGRREGGQLGWRCARRVTNNAK